MSCPRMQHRNNVPILRGEKHDISLKILHQAGFETARQAVTLAKLRTLAIAPRPSRDDVPSKPDPVKHFITHSLLHMT